MIAITLVLSIHSLILASVYGQSSDLQNPEKIFNSPNFGFKIKYPANWIVQEGDNYFSSGFWEPSIVPSGIAIAATFCPSPSDIGLESGSVDCYKNSPIHVEIDVFRLAEGTTLDEFYEQNVALEEKLGGIEQIESKKTEISGVPAYQLLNKAGQNKIQSDINELLDIENNDEEFNIMNVYTVSRDIGYHIFLPAENAKIFDDYLPTFQKMIKSFELLSLENR